MLHALKAGDQSQDAEEIQTSHPGFGMGTKNPRVFQCN